jgi:diguanylate cyclase (GGDEF)-like protein
MSVPEDLSAKFALVLREHVSQPGSEELLNQAYELGRLAISYGVSVLDMVQLYHDALRGMLAGTPIAVREAQLSKAAEFFAESLSSFEMLLRGYRDSNAELVKTNEVLRSTMAALERANRELERLATRDALTDASNRRHFLEIAAGRIEQMAANGEALAMLIIDIDHFKRINDSYGHLAGDEALRRFADAVRSELSDRDLFARLGGEEFAVLLVVDDALTAGRVAERIRSRIEALRVTSDGNQFGLTVSVGVAHCTRLDDTVERALGMADRALYEAKSGGRNRVHELRRPGPAAT